MKRIIIIGNNPFVDPTGRSTGELFALCGGNTGNVAFNYAVAKQFPDHVAFLPWGETPEKIRELGDIIVLPLANQLGPHTDMGEQAKALESYGLPVVGVGLGAQTASRVDEVRLTPGTERWLRVLADHSAKGRPNIGVRGDYTLGQIERRGIGNAAVVTGCPSNFIEFHSDMLGSIRRKQQHPIKRVAVSAGIPFLPSLAAIEAALADTVTGALSSYIVQHSKGMLHLARGETEQLPPDQRDLYRKYIRPQSSWRDFQLWCTAYAVSFFDAEDWMRHLQSFDYLIGTRFHGAMLAIQAGTPAGCIVHDSRTEELCDTMAIPYLTLADASGHDPAVWMNQMHVNIDKVTIRRAELAASYVSLLDAADIPTPSKLAAFSKSAHPKV